MHHGGAQWANPNPKMKENEVMYAVGLTGKELLSSESDLTLILVPKEDLFSLEPPN